VQPGQSYIVASQDSDMEGEELHGDDCKNSLQTVHRLGYLNVALPMLKCVSVSDVTDQDWLTLEQQPQPPAHL